MNRHLAEAKACVTSIKTAGDAAAPEAAQASLQRAVLSLIDAVEELDYENGQLRRQITRLESQLMRRGGR